MAAVDERGVAHMAWAVVIEQWWRAFSSELPAKPDFRVSSPDGEARQKQVTDNPVFQARRLRCCPLQLRHNERVGVIGGTAVPVRVIRKYPSASTSPPNHETENGNAADAVSQKSRSRLKDGKVIGVVNEDATEERRRQDAVDVLNTGILPDAFHAEEGQ